MPNKRVPSNQVVLLLSESLAAGKKTMKLWGKLSDNIIWNWSIVFDVEFIIKTCISRIYYLNFIGNTIRKCLNSQIQGMQCKYRQRAANQWRKESFLYRLNRRITQAMCATKVLFPNSFNKYIQNQKPNKNTNSTTRSILNSQTQPNIDPIIVKNAVTVTVAVTGMMRFLYRQISA